MYYLDEFEVLQGEKVSADAEKNLYEGVLTQSSPYDLTSEIRGLYFSAPSTTLGTFSWQMMNPAFYEAVQTELANPNSQFKQIYQQDYSKYWENPEEYQIHLATCPPLCNRIEDAYNIPYHIKYIYDPATGTHHFSATYAEHQAFLESLKQEE